MWPALSDPTDRRRPHLTRLSPRAPPRRSCARKPLYLDPIQLIEFTRFYADEVAAGRYPYVDYDPEQRWHQRIYRDPRMDIWLISWLPEQGTELHDHGGSAGSFTVLSGALTEAVVTSGTLRDTTRRGGDSVGFGAHYVHDVRNVSRRAGRQRARLLPAADHDDLLRPRRRQADPDRLAGHRRSRAGVRRCAGAS